jgi:hypothetical protein
MTGACKADRKRRQFSVRPRALGRQRDSEIIHFPCRLESRFQEHTCRLEDVKGVEAFASFVRDNNIDQALRALKKKMQR